MVSVRNCCRILGRLSLATSVCGVPMVVFTYALQPDHFAAFTLMPVWVWGGCGIFASVVAIQLLNTRLTWIPVAAWFGVILLFADEARTLGNFANETPKPGPAPPYKGEPVIRVITANCHTRTMTELMAWAPDIVLLQDAWPHQAHQIARQLFGKEANIQIHETNAIIARWKISDPVFTAHQRSQQATLHMPDGGSFHVVNVHLLSAATDLSLWRREVWTEHRINRAIRSNELNRALAALHTGPNLSDPAVILGGDFNAPPGDPIYRSLKNHFRDAHPAVGARWGNTYHRRFPILRIDRIHATRHFSAVRAGTGVAATSDHRFVIADFILTSPP